MSFNYYSCRNGGKIEYANKEFLEKEIGRIEEKIAISIGEENVDVNVIIPALFRFYNGMMKECLKELKKVEAFPSRLRFALETLQLFRAAMRNAIIESSDEQEIALMEKLEKEIDNS